MPLNFENTENAFAFRTTNELKKAKFLFSSMGSPWITNLGIKLTNMAFSMNLPIDGIIKSTIFKHFCGGETLSEAATTADALDVYGVDVIMDYGVEGKSDEAEFEKTKDTFLQTIKFVSKKKNIPFVSIKITGFARFELLEKINNKESLSQDEITEFDNVKKRINDVCNLAAEKNIMILIDAEESWIQQPVDDIADDMMAIYNKDHVVVYNTFQLYRHDRLDFLEKSCLKAEAQQYKLGAKLVRGAYMEKERERAIEKGYTSPINIDKMHTDNDYDNAVKFCLEHAQTISLFVGTHNENSCMQATMQMEKLNMDKHAKVYFSQLYGMSDNISFNLSKEGYLVSKYLPYGPVKEVIPYLMRRAQENTSVAGQTGRELKLINKELERRRKTK